jgi:raffinose/stachyose/melibiose transport system permease protein
MAAAALIGLAPAVLVFVLFQRYFIKGITAGALKG